MKNYLCLFIAALAAALFAADHVIEDWPPYAAEIAYDKIREPTSTLCIAEDGVAVTFLVMVPQYVGFGKEEEAALIKQYLKGYCDHIQSL